MWLGVIPAGELYSGGNNPPAESRRDPCTLRVRFQEIAGSGCCRRSKFENRYSALRLGRFAPSLLVALARVGDRFLGIGKGEIFGARLFQEFALSPPVVERPANGEDHHDNRNQQPNSPVRARGWFCRGWSGCIDSVPRDRGSLRRRAGGSGRRGDGRDGCGSGGSRFADLLRRWRGGYRCCCRFPRSC